MANFFKFWCYVFQRSSKNLLWLALSDEIHLISSSKLYRSILFMIKALNTERAYKRSAVCPLFASFEPIMAAFCSGHYVINLLLNLLLSAFKKWYTKLFVHNPNDLLTFLTVSWMFFLNKKLKKCAITSFPFGENSNFAGVRHAWVNKPIRAECCNFWLTGWAARPPFIGLLRI